jgi:hypothetical protein
VAIHALRDQREACRLERREVAAKGAEVFRVVSREAIGELSERDAPGGFELTEQVPLAGDLVVP